MSEVRKAVTVGPKGQVVIPASMRRQIGLEPGQRVDVRVKDGLLVLRPIPRDLLEKLHGCLAEGSSLTEALVREHAEELRREEERLHRASGGAEQVRPQSPTEER